MIRLLQESDGFILIDALVAVALVASAGTIIYLIGQDVLQQQDRRLDRSVALTNLKSIAQETTLLGVPRSTAVREDELYSYNIRKTPDESSVLLRTLTIEATPRRGGTPESISVLAPVLQP